MKNILFFALIFSSSSLVSMVIEEADMAFLGSFAHAVVHKEFALASEKTISFPDVIDSQMRYEMFAQEVPVVLQHLDENVPEHENEFLEDLRQVKSPLRLEDTFKFLVIEYAGFARGDDLVQFKKDPAAVKFQESIRPRYMQFLKSGDTNKILTAQQLSLFTAFPRYSQYVKKITQEKKS